MSIAAACVYNWDSLAVDHPIALLDRRRIMGEHVMLSHVTLHKGFTVATHQHENEQMAVVLSGCVRFTVEDPAREVIVKAGEVLHLPSNVPHAAEALETSVILDIFSPPSATTGVDTARA